MNSSSKGGIPRLQELSFLGVTAQHVAENCTFDEIRRALIDHMTGLREVIAPTGNHAIFRLARHNPYRYFNNAAEALAELMLLGMAEKATVPHTKTAVDAYSKRTFKLTEAGETWVAQLNQSGHQAAAYDALLLVLWHHHPQFSGYLQLLSRTMLVIPAAKWTDSQQAATGKEDRRSYIRFLASRASKAVQAGVTGWQATEPEIEAAITTYIDERIKAATSRQRPDPYPRHGDFVRACEEALVSFAFRQAGLPLDYISHEILRRWTKSLAVANFSYHVPTAAALRLWATADIRVVNDVPQVQRRNVHDWGDRIIEALPEAFEWARKQEPANSFVPIYRVRAAVCSKLGLSDPVFDMALREFLAGERRPDSTFRLNLDSSVFGNVPPTEQPLKLTDRSGRTQVYHVMTLLSLTKGN